MNTEIMLSYLTELSKNNNREWYHAHKAEYLEATAAFEELVQELIVQLGKLDSRILNYSPKELTFKLVRDTRFSNDKSPYNPSFRAHISSMGKLPVPVGFYIMITPGGGSFLGGGLFAHMFKDATAMVRDHICAYPEQWSRIIEEPDFKELFHVQGNTLKNVPAGYDKDHPHAQYLKYKSWFLEYPLRDEVILDSDNFTDLAVSVFTKMKPFNDFLNQALSDFKMPER